MKRAVPPPRDPPVQEGGLAGLGRELSRGGLGGRTRKEDCEGGLGGRTVCGRLWRCDQLCYYLAAQHPGALGELPGFLEDWGGEEYPVRLTCR